MDTGNKLSTSIRRSLSAVGANSFSLYMPELRYMETLLYPDEVINGIVLGKYSHFIEHLSGRGILLATNKRILLIDKKPIFSWYEELSYNVVSGVIVKSTGLRSSLVLETRAGDISMKTFNINTAQIFAKAVETQLIAQTRQLFTGS